jgi:hypothetical protein
VISESSYARTENLVYPKKEIKKMKKYKLSLNNIGYEHSYETDGFKGTLKECKREINYITNNFTRKKIDGFPINYLIKSKEITEEKFKEDVYLIVFEVPNDTGRCLVIWKRGNN